MVDEDKNHGIEEDILDKPGASARETESCSLRSTVILQGCETWQSSNENHDGDDDDCCDNNDYGDVDDHGEQCSKVVRPAVSLYIQLFIA